MTLQILGDRDAAKIGLYTGSCCGRCGYGSDRGDDAPVALVSAAGVLDGETLCLRCFADEIGDHLSATHRL